MTAEVLLEHFHRLGDAPDAVPRLRRFILDLAVRGKLMPQVNGDETAADLLERLGISSDNEVASYTLPQNWAWIRLGALTYERGETINPAHHLDEQFVLWSVPAFSYGKPEIVLGRNIGASKPSIEPGVILISRINPHLNRVWITQPVPGYRHIASSEWIVLNPSGLLPAYLQWSLRSPYFFEQFCSVLTGIGGSLTRVRPADAVKYPLAIPPLAEQHRIVAKVDELMALCDRLEAAQQQREQERTRLTAASWQALVTEGTPGRGPGRATEAARFALEQLPALTTRPAQVKTLRQTILDLAVVGKLTERKKSDMNALKELERIAKKKEEAALRKSKKIATITSEEWWCDLPNGWTWARWDAITDWITYGFTRPMPHEGSGVPIVTSKNVNYGKIIFDTADRTTPGAFAELNEKDKPQRGDILLTKDGSIGRSAIVDTDDEFCINQAVAVLWLRSCHFDRRFLQMVIQSPQTQGQLLAKTEGVAIKHISVVDFGRMLLPVPPLAEQGRIVAKVDALMGLCDRLEAALLEGEAVGGRLLEAVLHTEAAPRTIPPTPVHQLLPTRQHKQAVYEEVEEELALAAEPSAPLHYAVVRRAPGRPRKDANLTTTATRAILDHLQGNPGWHGKSAILEATGVDASAWNAAIKELMEAGQVEREGEGEKKGARYRGAIE